VRAMQLALPFALAGRDRGGLISLSEAARGHFIAKNGHNQPRRPMLSTAAVPLPATRCCCPSAADTLSTLSEGLFGSRS